MNIGTILFSVSFGCPLKSIDCYQLLFRSYEKMKFWIKQFHSENGTKKPQFFQWQLFIFCLCLLFIPIFFYGKQVQKMSHFIALRFHIKMVKLVYRNFEIYIFDHFNAKTLEPDTFNWVIG